MNAILMEFLPYALIGIVLLGAFLYVKSLQRRIESLKTANTTLSVNLDTSNKSIVALQVSITKQNDYIDKLNKDSADRLARNEVLLKKSNAMAQVYKQKANDYANAQPQSPDMCISANALINSALKNE